MKAIVIIFNIVNLYIYLLYKQIVYYFKNSKICKYIKKESQEWANAAGNTLNNL